jgi:hypothetical protein
MIIVIVIIIPTTAAAAIIVIIIIVVVATVQKIPVARVDFQAASPDFVGFGTLALLLENGACGSVIDQLELVAPADRFDLDLRRRILDLDELIPQILEVRDDRIREGVGKGTGGPECGPGGEYQGFLHLMVLSCGAGKTASRHRT